MSPADDPGKARAEKRRLFRRLKVARAEGLLRGVLSQLRPGDIAIDCGANVGKVTVPLAETGAEVHAFEPDPVAFAALQTATAGHGNVTLIQAAVGPAAGTATLHRGAGFHDDPVATTVRSTVLPGANRMEADPATTVEVEVIDLPERLATWAEQGRDITFLKLDIEGAELDLLEALLTRGLLDKIRLTVAETHEYKFPALRPRFKALRTAIAARYPKTRVDLDWI